MGIDALTTAADGRPVAPETDEEWLDWVRATATRNHALDDPLLDWLDLYGKERGFLRDDELDDYDPRTDFREFIMRKGREFEDAVVVKLGTLVPVHAIATGESGSRDLKAAEETFAAMSRGEPVIWQAVLRDAESRTHGTADLLVRSDTLRELFPDSITSEASSTPAPDLDGGPWHYRVVDIKFATLHFYAGGGLSDTNGSVWAYKTQVYIYNRALGRLQGYLAPEAYLLGRGWQRTANRQTERGSSCLDRLGPVPQDHVSRSRGPLALAVDQAVAWVRRARTDGEGWDLLPQPSVPELRPNMAHTSDQPWHRQKQRIATEIEDLTLLWQVGLGKRDDANRAGLLHWSDPACSAESIGITGAKRAPTLDAIIAINRSADGPPIRPDRVVAGESRWRPEPRLEFYVDFETVSDLDDDFSRIPHKGGQPLIFMIGCGHVEAGEWMWSCFTADGLSEQCEADIIDAWFDHMEETRQRLDPTGETPSAFHWSHAEQSTLETAFNSAKSRHPEKAWPSPRWFDFLGRVVREEPLVIQGAFQFGLKSVAKAMHTLGLIETAWEAGPTDGLGAMAGAWSCAAEAGERGRTLAETELMQEIARYNEVDCKVIMEIVAYLRANH